MPADVVGLAVRVAELAALLAELPVAQRTAVVLDHFDHEINTKLGGVQTADGEQRSVRIMLLAGSDLIATMSEPGVWSEADVRPFPFSASSLLS